ncbi:MAG: DegV family protein [Eubacteriales bacterium]|nr:DegV family protein [Eubacteriales bacterium]
MDKKIAFIADSCADLPGETLKREDVFVLPVTVSCEGKDYLDGKDIHADRIYELQKKGELPSTSLPSGEQVETLLQRVKDGGYDKAVVITMSSAISGTWNMCRLLCGEYVGLDCLVFDSGMASLAEGALLVELIDEVDAGLVDWEGIPERLKELKENTHPYFGLDTLEFLQKNGRIGKAAAMAGNLLNLMPILSFDEKGVITPVEKVRGKKKRLLHLKNHAVEMAKQYGKCRLYFVDGGCTEMVEELKQSILKELGEDVKTMTSPLGCALAVHLGENLVGVCVQEVKE